MMSTSTGNKLCDFTILLSRVYKEQTQMEITSLVETLSLIPFLLVLSQFSVLFPKPRTPALYQLILGYLPQQLFPLIITESASVTCLQHVLIKHAQNGFFLSYLGRNQFLQLTFQACELLKQRTTFWLMSVLFQMLIR